jgi:GH43 family beta-xylosidase
MTHNSKMNSASTVGNTVKISTPTYDWEKVGANVNEGPAGLYYAGRTFVVYSASNCAGTGYKLGRLELTGSDPLSASSWTKYSTPILQSANGNYQPGHNGFFNGPSGSTYIVFHANSATPGTCDGNRYTMVQPVYWHTDSETNFLLVAYQPVKLMHIPVDSPNLGSPRALSDAIPEPT